MLAERTGISIGVSAMSRLLSRLGIGLKRPTPIVECLDESVSDTPVASTRR